MGKNKDNKKSWKKLIVAFVFGGALTTILDLPGKITSFKNALTGETPVERVLQTETVRSLSDDLTLLLVDVNPQALRYTQKTGAIIRLTVNQENLRRLEKLNAMPGFSSIAKLHIDRTSTIMNGVGLKGRVNDQNPVGLLTPVDMYILKPLR